jgi:hypothetical protein
LHRLPALQPLSEILFAVEEADLENRCATAQRKRSLGGCSNLLGNTELVVHLEVDDGGGGSKPTLAGRFLSCTNVAAPLSTPPLHLHSHFVIEKGRRNTNALQLRRRTVDRSTNNSAPQVSICHPPAEARSPVSQAPTIRLYKSRHNDPPQDLIFGCMRKLYVV